MHKALISLILAFLTCISACAVHVPRSPQPEPFGQDDKAAWLRYYERSFEQYREAVLPPKEDEPAAAREAYVEAKAAWERQEIQETALVLGFMVLVIVWLRIALNERI